jgi:periplasmic protein CpxP/Spy
MMLVSKKINLKDKTMNFKNLSIVASLFAFSLTAIPFAAKADVFAPNSHSQVVAQAQHVKKDRKANFERFTQELGLTDSQQSRLAEIRNNTRTKVDAILTPEQRQANLQKRQEGRKNREFRASLSDDQKTQIRQIMQSSKAEMEAVLTPEQKQKFEQLRQNRRDRHQQRQQSNGTNR